ncbi:ATP-binding protein [Ramlibacter algicola]|uniref:histidine kinase n=1 Tax=Ramlibacter algicola TaxID=2795217 RepID=A0A934UQH6_9BURK|nr:ATP-binding protein [Ramlibacter algicola]MBK0391658.1 sensor histidine kinase N-terminal domain-containing protein [Ramlibacter algicola]
MRWHVLPAGPMCSLRRALLLWLVPLFLLVGAASAALSYWTYNRMVGQFMDEQMEQLAQSIALQEEHVSLRKADPERVHSWGVYIAQVWTPDGRLDASSLPDVAVPLAPRPGFSDVALDGKLWRVVTTASPITGKQVQVLQSGDFRRKLAVERAGAAIAPVMILLPLALLILWGVAGKLSREIHAVGEQLARQDVNTLDDLPLTRVPSEIAPLVGSFNALLARLREAIAQKRRFMQDAAHELRTPITAVALQLENVRRDLPSGACQQSFSQLEAGVSRAQRLVDQLLKMSRNEGATPEAPVTIDLQAQVHQSVDGLIALADQRGIDLGLVVDESARKSAVLRCGAGDLRSVLDNLIENALRYTPEGGVVDVRLAGSAAGPVIEVVDTGPGIPPDQLPRVFDRFFRVPGTTARGSGLGLSIAQNAAQRCGLRIVLRNRTDRSGLVARIEPLLASAAAPRLGSEPALAS